MQTTPMQAADLQRKAQQALALGGSDGGGQKEQKGGQDAAKQGGSFTMPTREAS